MEATPGTAAKRYEALTTTRAPYLDRARECAKVTIPSLMPPQGATGTTRLPTPFQSIGARGVNNLASKLLLALLPPNAPFFRLRITDPETEAEAEAQGATSVLEKALSLIEQRVMEDVETSGDRVKVFEAKKQLLVSGNVLLYAGADDSRIYRLDRFVVNRDPSGNVLEHISLEYVAPEALTEETRKALAEVIQESDRAGSTPATKVDDGLPLYTHVTRGERQWTVYQEVRGVRFNEGTYALDKSPWLALRGIAVAGEDYGRSYVEEYLGDLLSLEGLSQSIVEASAAAARLLVFVNPNGITKRKDVTDAPNGAVVAGNAEDVSLLTLQKFADLRVARETAVGIEERLGFAFLLNSAVQRPGERVTAEEIRYVAGELEEALGGVYSVLSQEFQLPYARVKLAQLQKRGVLPQLPKGAVSPQIVTGLEALGRGHDLRKLDLFLSGPQHIMTPDVIREYLDIGDYLTQRAAAIGVKVRVRSEEEVAQNRQQQQAAAMAAATAPKAIDAGVKLAQQPSEQEAQ